MRSSRGPVDEQQKAILRSGRLKTCATAPATDSQTIKYLNNDIIYG